MLRLLCACRYVERTIRQLQGDKGAKQMQFGQVYKDRHGRAVPCQDLHTFNRDEKNRVVSDYVVVRPEGPPVPAMVPSMSGHGEPLTVIGTQAVRVDPLPQLHACTCVSGMLCCVVTYHTVLLQFLLWDLPLGYLFCYDVSLLFDLCHMLYRVVLLIIVSQQRKARMIMGGGGGGGGVQPDFGAASRGMSPLMMDVSDDKFEVRLLSCSVSLFAFFRWVLSRFACCLVSFLCIASCLFVDAPSLTSVIFIAGRGLTAAASVWCIR